MQRLRHILLYVDGAEPDPELLERIGSVAIEQGAKLTLVAVVEPARSRILLAKPGFDVENLEGLLVEDRRRKLAEAVEKTNIGGVETAVSVLVGHPVTSVLEEVQSQEVDLLCKAPTPADGLRQQIFGSIDQQLMRACPCPVAITRPKAKRSHTAVVALDFDGDNEQKRDLNTRILDSTQFALRGGITSIHVIHAWSLYGYSLLAEGRTKLSPEDLENAMQRERAKRKEWLEGRVETHRQTLDETQSVGFNPTLELLDGDPREIVPLRAGQLDADVIGLGTMTRTGVQGLLIGNTAEEILERVNCTVVVHKPAGFVCPVPPKG